MSQSSVDGVRTAVVVVDSETVDVVVDWGIEVVVEGIVEDCADVGGSAAVVVAVSEVPQALRRRPMAMTAILDFDPTELMTGGYIRSATESALRAVLTSAGGVESPYPYVASRRTIRLQSKGSAQ